MPSTKFLNKLISYRSIYLAHLTNIKLAYTVIVELLVSLLSSPPIFVENCVKDRNFKLYGHVNLYS